MKKQFRKALQRLGFDLVRYGGPRLGIDPFTDMKYFMGMETAPMVFGVGANRGQSIDRFLSTFPNCQIHSFEPSPSVYQELKVSAESKPQVVVHNKAVGANRGQVTFVENTHSDMSSVLEPSEAAWGSVIGRIPVELVSLDEFIKEASVPRIDILKIDTQGYELEVLKGAKSLAARNLISLIYLEVIFSKMYSNLPPVAEIFAFMDKHNFKLVAYYTPFFQRDLLSWTDMLFINVAYHARHLSENPSR